MAATTKIEWCDHTASPWYGCTKVAPGCENCYAAAQSVRNPGVLGVWGPQGTRVKSKSFVANLWKWNRQAERAGQIVSVFPSLCDPFEDRPELVPWRREMFDVIDECPHVRLLLLTKRPENIPTLTPSSHNGGWYRSNVWLGTSVATQADADKNISELLGCRDLSPVLFVSAEPLLESIDLTNQGHGHLYVTDLPNGQRTGINWAIVGGESGPHARPCNVSWVRSLVDQCRAAGVPCFVKQLGGNAISSGDEGTAFALPLRHPKGGNPAEWPEDVRVREWPGQRGET